MVSPILRLITVRLVRPVLHLIHQVQAPVRIDVQFVALEPLVHVIDPRLRVLPRCGVRLRLEALALEPVDLVRRLMPAIPPTMPPRILKRLRLPHKIVL